MAPKEHSFMNRCLHRSFMRAQFPLIFLVCGASVCIFSGCKSAAPDPMVTYQQLYIHPLVSSGAQFSTLPAAVQRTVCAETGSASIAQVDKHLIGTQTVYCIFFQNYELFPPLNVASDGSVLDPDLRVAVGAPRDLFSTGSLGPVSRVSPDELPPQVVKAIQRLAPDAEVDVITREQDGQQTAFVVSFKGRSHPVLKLGADGTPLK